MQRALRNARTRIRDAYPDSTYNRLAELKRIYDPENFFQLNQNIRPR